MKVTLLAYTPEGSKICNNAARICYSSQLPSDVDIDPSNRSMKNAIKSGHTSVLEHCTFTFAIEGISRACSHQLVRHRFISPSQQSQRYVKMDGFDYVIPDSIANSDVDIYYGEDIDGSEVTRTLKEEYEALMYDISQFYEFAIANGIPKEDARMVLPNACTTNLVITANARELIHFFGLRCCTRAQKEIRTLAESMLRLCQQVEPDIFENVGANCVQLGYCPEDKSCGKAKTLIEIKGGN